MAREEVYVNMMVDTLERKKVILEQLFHQTKVQETLLKEEEMDMDSFQQMIDLKGEEIEKLKYLVEIPLSACYNIGNFCRTVCVV